jgi:hypothetical protein
MRIHLSRFQPQSDDENRYLRLARGMRAIAAAVVVVGIVVATFETAAPPTQRVRPTDATPEDARAYAVVEPHAAMATAAPAAQAVVAAARNVDPASARLDRDKEQRG